MAKYKFMSGSIIFIRRSASIFLFTLYVFTLNFCTETNASPSIHIDNYQLGYESGTAVKINENCFLFENLSLSDIYSPLKGLAYGIAFSSALSFISYKAGVSLNKNPSNSFLIKSLFFLSAFIYCDAFLSKLYYDIKLAFNCLTIDSTTTYLIFFASVISFHQAGINQPRSFNPNSMLSKIITPYSLILIPVAHLALKAWNSFSSSTNYNSNQKLGLSGDIANNFEISIQNKRNYSSYIINRLIINQTQTDTYPSYDNQSDDWSDDQSNNQNAYRSLALVMDEHDIKYLQLTPQPIYFSHNNNIEITNDSVNIFIYLKFTKNSNDKKLPHFLKATIKSPGLSNSNLLLTLFSNQHTLTNSVRSILEPDIINAISNNIKTTFGNNTISIINTTLSNDIPENVATIDNSTLGSLSITLGDDDTAPYFIWNNHDHSLSFHSVCEDENGCIANTYKIPESISKTVINFSTGLLYIYGTRLTQYLGEKLLSGQYIIHKGFTTPKDTDPKCGVCYTKDNINGLPCTGKHPICESCLSMLIKTKQIDRTKDQALISNILSSSIKCPFCRDEITFSIW